MISQKFKGDDTELKMEAAALPAFQVCNTGLDAFALSGYNASPFLLGMYDDGRMPFADRVPRDSFVAFIKEALARFPFTGSFESYIFILEAIFGAGSGVLFNIPAPGKLEIAVNAASSIEFDWITAEFVDGVLTNSTMIDSSGSQMVFGGVSGIDSEFELEMLLAEIIPGGIFPAVTLAFFAIFNFVDDGGNTMVDHLGNNIVFIET